MTNGNEGRPSGEPRTLDPQQLALRQLAAMARRMCKLGTLAASALLFDARRAPLHPDESDDCTPELSRAIAVRLGQSEELLWRAVANLITHHGNLPPHMYVDRYGGFRPGVPEPTAEDDDIPWPEA
jgi:hypothetical protein